MVTGEFRKPMGVYEHFGCSLDKVCAVPKAQRTKCFSNSRSSKDRWGWKGVIGKCLRFRGGIWEGKKRGRIVAAKSLDHLCNTGYVVV